MVDFECLPKVIREIAWLKGDWVLEDAYPHEARVTIAVDVEVAHASAQLLTVQVDPPP